MSLLLRNKWMAEHRRIVCATVAALIVFALLGGVYCTGWLRESGTIDHRAHFKILPSEHLEYRASSWMGETGIITVDVGPLQKHGDGSGTYRIVYTLESSKKVSAVYIMKGQVTAVVDARTLLPLEFEEKMRTGLAVKGGRDKHKKLVYDRNTNQVAYYKVRRRAEDKSLVFKSSRRIPPDSHHYASLLYYMRFVDFKPGQAISIPMSDRKRDLTIKASVVREEDYKALDGSTRKAVLLKTVTDFGKEDIKDSTFDIWLDKEERYPVRMEVKVKWGTVKLKLVKRTIKEAAPAHANEGDRDHSGKI